MPCPNLRDAGGRLWPCTRRNMRHSRANRVDRLATLREVRGIAARAARCMRQPPGLRFAPYLFIVIWSSGYVVAKFGVPYAGPLTFLSIRYAGVIVLMAALSLVSHARWPASSRELAHIAIAGLLMQAG